MGLWDWIISTLTTRRAPEAAEDDRVFSHAAVGLLERPASNAGGSAGYPDAPMWWAAPEATLTELAEVPRPEMSPEAQALENLLASHLDGHDLTLPRMPRTPERVLQRLGNRHCSLVSVAADIAEDAVVAGALLRTTNSPLYRGLEKITTLETAVARLGTQSIRTLMLSESLRAAAFMRKSGDNTLAKTLWRRSLASACIMRELAAPARLDPEDCFLIGLLHDVGNVVVLRLVHQHEALMHGAIDAATFEYVCFQCHQEFGELLAKEWALPDQLRSLISSHHAPPSADDPLRRQRLLVQAEEMVLSLLGFAPESAYDLLNSAPIVGLGLAESEELIDVLANLPARVEETVAAL